MIKEETQQRIHQLSMQLSNQIAAGEVIERPASVVKELLENSIDAGAKRLHIVIQGGGMQLIQIRDDGAGIHVDDLPLSIARHATSKISEFNDLQSIMSLGFRGEALASISSVSHFSICSKTVDADAAYEVTVDNEGKNVDIKPAGHPVGTTVTVRDLFYNTPARRKFMRTDKTEFSHIETVVKRIALACFDVAISLEHNKRLVLQLPAANTLGQQEKRIEKIFGKQFMQQAKTIDESVANLRLWGWLAEPSFMRSSNDLQYVYINGRMIKDKLVMHAIRQAYQDYLFEGRQAAYALYLECDPQQLDVNVHPTKHEVRFREARLVHDFLFSSVAKVLAPEDKSIPTSEIVEMPIMQEENLSASLSSPDNTPREEDSSRMTQGVQTSYSTPSRHSFSRSVSEHSVQQAMSGYRKLAMNETEREADEHQWGELQAILYKQYALLQKEESVYFLHLQAAEQQWVYLQLQEPEELISRPLLVPLTIPLTEKEMSLVIALQEEFLTMKCRIELLGPDSIAIREIPTLFNQVNLQNLLKETLANWNSESKLLNCLARCAGKNVNWSRPRVMQLCRDLRRHDYPTINFMGERIWSELKENDLKKLLQS